LQKINKNNINMQIDIENLVREEVAKQLAEMGTTVKEPIKERIAVGQKQLAEYCGASVITVSRWQSDGKLKGCFTRVGHKVIYDLNKIDAKFAG
jgi:hypothetical protein